MTPGASVDICDKSQFADLAVCSQSLFFELAAHAHNFKFTKQLKQFELSTLPAEDRDFYFRTVESLNYSSLFITLCKVMEFHKAFRKILPSELRYRLDLINMRLTKSKALDFRNKYAGHLFDNSTRRPIARELLINYAQTLIVDDSEEEFRKWWWSDRNEPKTSVASTLHEIRLYASDVLSGALRNKA